VAKICCDCTIRRNTVSHTHSTPTSATYELTIPVAAQVVPIGVTPGIYFLPDQYPRLIFNTPTHLDYFGTLRALPCSGTAKYEYH